VRTDATLEDLLRQLAPQVLGTLVRRHGHFDACEDAVQEALLAAATTWPVEGLPDRPIAWLVTVASRRLIDELRSSGSRRVREEADVRAATAEAFDVSAADDDRPRGDDTLAVLFLCCHPSLSPVSQMALTLRAVGGLTTSEIAHAFLVPEAAMSRRISRAKQGIAQVADADALGPLSESERGERLGMVMHVLYLIFNEGYLATSGSQLQRRDLAAEAIRLTRLLHRLVPDDGEVVGLLALMLLTDARHEARCGPDGSLIPLAEQDRSRWDRASIDEGVEILLAALSKGRIGPYQLQAAIAAAHDEAPSLDATDWAEILGLYRLLQRVAPSPVLTLNQVVAEAQVNGVRAGFRLLATIEDDPQLAGNHRVRAVRAHLYEQDGNLEAAGREYREAARRTASIPERRHLEGRAASLAEHRRRDG
jgi:RNA polymerase sigma factor (sigma-70 family)